MEITPYNILAYQGRRTKIGQGGEGFFWPGARSARENPPPPRGMIFPFWHTFRFFFLYIFRIAKSSGSTPMLRLMSGCQGNIFFVCCK